MSKASKNEINTYLKKIYDSFHSNRGCTNEKEMTPSFFQNSLKRKRFSIKVKIPFYLAKKLERELKRFFKRHDVTIELDRSNKYKVTLTSLAL